MSELAPSGAKNRLRKKSLLRIESGPQRLKPDLFSISYVRAKARTLQKPEFFRSKVDVRAKARTHEFSRIWSLKGTAFRPSMYTPEEMRL